MKKIIIASLSICAVITSITLSGNLPVLSNLFSSDSAIAQKAKEGQINLRLSAAKKSLEKDASGKSKINWQQLADGAVVQPGDILRYSVAGINKSDKPVKNLTVNQAIPKGMKYVLNSATVENLENSAGAEITYSIDGGKSFVKNPTIEKKMPDGTLQTLPAPDTAYTHIRWQFNQDIPAKNQVTGTYQLKVR